MDKARDASKGSLYFPSGIYPGSFKFFHEHGSLFITGDGIKTVLTSAGNPQSGPPDPVVTLGFGDGPHSALSKMSNLVPVPQISFGAVEEQPQITGAFDELSTTGLKILLTDASMENPVDGSFSFSVV